MNMHKTTQFLYSGDYHRYYSLLPPAINTGGSALMVIVNSVTLKGLAEGGEFLGIKDDRVILMGNGQIVNSEPCSIQEYLNEFPFLSEDDNELVANLIKQQLIELEQSINQ